MNKTEKIVKTVKEKMKDYDIEKIFWNSKLGKVIVITNTKSGYDGIYLFENNLEWQKIFTPNENFKLYHEVVNDDNLIYEK